MEDNSIPRPAPFKNINSVVYIFLGLILVFFLYQILGGIIQLVTVGEDFSSTTAKLTITRITISFSQLMFILFPAVLLAYLQGDKVKQTFRLKAPKLSVFFFSIIGILVVQPFLQFFMYYQNKIIFSIPFGHEVIQNMKELFDMLEASTLRLVTAYSFAEFAAIVIVIAITPAICEEFLFRGFVLSNFEKTGKKNLAIVMSGLLFALFHFHPFNLIPLAILGIYLSFVAYHSGSIFTAMICHFINNFISVLAVYLYDKDEFISKEIPDNEIMQVILLGVASMFIFTGIVMVIKKLSVVKNLPNLNTTAIE